ncbi:MAG: hypothetical protein ACLR0U_05895 [Enterocloster clostridioformis]
MVPRAHALYSLQVEGIVQMLFAKGKEAVVAFNQIRDYNVTVIITVDILYAEDGICFVAAAVQTLWCCLCRRAGWLPE